MLTEKSKMMKDVKCLTLTGVLARACSSSRLSAVPVGAFPTQQLQPWKM